MGLSKTKIPAGLKADEVNSILREAKRVKNLSERIDLISAHFIGRPYIAGSLGGGPDVAEPFCATLEGFDCVTYIETVLALASSNSLGDVADALREIRYKDGKVDWFHRNHYMTTWASNNSARGIIAPLKVETNTVERHRRLDVVEGLPLMEANLSFIAKKSFKQVSRHIETGDMIFFVSTKKNLDFFHTGLLVVKDGRVMLRHATRSEGKVIEQPVEDFLNSHKMSGFILLRPLCQN